jgi:hypothetical protein
MTRLIEFPLEDGDFILVEVDDTELGEGIIEASDNGDILTRATKTFEEALSKIKPVAVAITNRLKGLSEPPDEIEIEFGLKMDAKAGAFLAATTIGANYKVTLTWKHND